MLMIKALDVWALSRSIIGSMRKGIWLTHWYPCWVSLLRIKVLERAVVLYHVGLAITHSMLAPGDVSVAVLRFIEITQVEQLIIPNTQARISHTVTQILLRATERRV
jgi:hypothetical protein